MQLIKHISQRIGAAASALLLLLESFGG
jgi:hypothetical protein